MYARISDDIMKILQFELAQGNEVFDTGSAAGYTFTELLRRFHSDAKGFKELLVPTILPWKWSSPHYQDEYEGYKSTIFPYDTIGIRIRKPKYPNIKYWEFTGTRAVI